MTVARERHEEYGAAFGNREGTEIVEGYGRPARAARAIRNVVGAIEMGYGIVAVAGDDRHEFVDDAVSNRVPERDGEGCYALLLDPQGGIRTDMYVYCAGERLLLLTPPGRAGPLVEDWQDKVFIQDVEIHDASEEFAVFGVHGPKSTEKIASVLEGATPPEKPLSFVRGSMHGIGVTVIATDAPLGEDGYEVICAAPDAAQVLETLLTRGLNAAPVGYRSWDVLTLEAGTPLFETELRDRVPNVVGVRNALDFQKGCYVGQEVVSKIENRGRPSHRLVGLELERSTELSGPDASTLAGATVTNTDADSVGEITRASPWSTVERPIAMAVLEFEATAAEGTSLSLKTDDGELSVERARLPFAEGSARSARLPSYPVDTPDADS